MAVLLQYCIFEPPPGNGGSAPPLPHNALTFILAYIDASNINCRY